MPTRPFTPPPLHSETRSSARVSPSNSQEDNGDVDDDDPSASSAHKARGLLLWNAALKGHQQEVKRLLEERADVNFKVEESNKQAFKYKSRKITTQPLHVAAASDQSFQVVKLLIENRAEVNAQATNSAHGEVRAMEAIHIAAGRGSVKILSLLIDSGADPDASVTRNNVAYYKPIHDAVWFNQEACVDCLIHKRCQLGSKNSDGNTALHFASMLGHADLVKKLTSTNDLSLCFRSTSVGHLQAGSKKVEYTKNNQSKCPLDLAVESDRFPPARLNLFTQNMDDADKVKAFVKVARTCPAAASTLLRTQQTCTSQLEDSRGPIDDEWQRSLRDGSKNDEINAQILALLIRDAPQAAVDLIDVLAVSPEISDAEHNPLPIRAIIPQCPNEPCPVSCTYEEDKDWVWDSKTQIKAWQRKLAPKDPQRGKEVSVRVLLLKGALNLQLAHCLAESKDHHIFSKLVIHALLKHMWSRIRWMFYVDLLHQALVVMVVSLWSRGCCRPDYRLARRMLWCLVSSQGTIELVMVATSAVNCKRKLGLVPLWEWFRRTWHRLLITLSTISLAMATAADSWPDEETPKWILSVNVLLHWLFFLFELRAIGAFGRRLLPILKSVQPIAGMCLIMFFLVAAFVHAFWAMDPNIAWIDVVTLLFTGEGFIDSSELRAMDDSNRHLTLTLTCFSIFVFMACALNVFIAVLSDCYDQEQDNMVPSFMKERARVCSGLLLRPGWEQWNLPNAKCQFHRGLIGVCSFLSVILFLLTSWLDYTPWIPTIFTTASMVLLQGAIKSTQTAGWPRRYLWLCHEKNIDEEMFLSSTDRDMVQNYGKIAKIKRYIYEQCRQAGHRNNQMNNFSRVVEMLMERMEAAGAGAARKPSAPFVFPKKQPMTPKPASLGRVLSMRDISRDCENESGNESPKSKSRCSTNELCDKIEKLEGTVGDMAKKLESTYAAQMRLEKAFVELAGMRDTVEQLGSIMKKAQERSEMRRKELSPLSAKAPKLSRAEVPAIQNAPDPDEADGGSKAVELS